MNIEAYNLDSLRKLVRDLEKENKSLKALLERADIPYAQSEVFLDIPTISEDYDPDQGARINEQHIDKNIATKFFAMFWGRNRSLYSEKFWFPASGPGQCVNKFEIVSLL